MKLAIVNPITQTSPDRWSVPTVQSNRQCIAMQMGRALERLGDEVVVVAAEPFRPAVADEGVRTEYLPAAGGLLSPPAQLPSMPGLEGFIRGERFDAVLSGEVFQWATFTLARMVSRGGPPLFVWHEADRYQRLVFTIPARVYYATAGRTIFRAATNVLPRSATSPGFLLANGLAADKIGPQIPNGFDEALFFPRRDLRRSTPRLLYVGSLIERKEPGLCIRALAKVRERFPETTLRMKGTGALEGGLRRLAEESGVTDAVVFDVERSDLVGMAEIYNEAWVGVFPSQRDFVSLAPIEAAACGVPLVVSERLTHAGYVERAGIGETSVGEVEQFADAACRVIERYGIAGLDEAVVDKVREDYALGFVARRLHEYVVATLNGRAT